MTRTAFFLLILLSAPGFASPPAEWLVAPNARAEYAQEPVFGGRVALFRAGPDEAETIVLVHGLGNAAARDWSRVIPALAKRYHVIAPDLPGFGHSDKGNHYYSPENFARVLEAVLPDSGRFTLVGHSMGATVALAFAAANPERVNRLVLVDAAGILHRSVYTEFLAKVAIQRAIGRDSRWYQPVMRAIEARVENWPLEGDLAIERAGVRRRWLRGDPTAISAFAMVEHDFGEALRAIRVPTLVVWGAHDQIAPLRTGYALASAIPQARLVVLEGLGHAPQIEAPDRFNPILLEELDGRQLAAQPYALRKGAIREKKREKCNGRRGAEFSGDYESLVLENCQDARIVDSRIGRLEVSHSTVKVVNSHIRDGIDGKSSRLELTGGSVGGRVELRATNLDAAATRFESEHAVSNSGDLPLVVRLSVAEVSRAGNAPLLLHDIFRIAPGETLIR